MGDRKVLNQYYPPDFDPSKLPRVRRAEGNMLKVRASDENERTHAFPHAPPATQSPRCPPPHHSAFARPSHPCQPTGPHDAAHVHPVRHVRHIHEQGVFFLFLFLGSPHLLLATFTFPNPPPLGLCPFFLARPPALLPSPMRGTAPPAASPLTHTPPAHQQKHKQGTKFNTRKEDVPGETYLGIQVFRFTFRCSTCSGAIAFMTDAANTDYAV